VLLVRTPVRPRLSQVFVHLDKEASGFMEWAHGTRSFGVVLRASGRWSDVRLRAH
jgi:hypothetical protein